MNSKKLVFMAILLSLSLVIYIIEAQIPPLVPIPGFKIGLANSITLFALATLKKRDALIILVLRIIIASVFSGGMSVFLYSISGGMLCFIVEALIINLFTEKQLWIVSIFGAISHNIGQVLVAVLITKTPYIAWYIMPLTAISVITGLFIGILTTMLLLHSNGILKKSVKDINT